MDREALTPFRCKTSSSLLSNNILRPETAAAVPVGLLFLSVTATRCFILALFSRGGEVSPQGAALRLLQPAKWHRPAPSSSQSQKPGRAELLRTAMAEVTAGCSESIFVLPQNTGPLCFLVFHCLSCTAKPLCSPLQLLALHPAGCSHSTAGCIVPPAGSAASKHPLQLCVTVRYGNYVNAPACVQCKPEL